MISVFKRYLSNEAMQVSVKVFALPQIVTTEECHDVPSFLCNESFSPLCPTIQTRIAILRWIFHLHLKTPHRLFLHVDDLFPVLMDTIKNRSDEVVLLDLQVLAELASSPGIMTILNSCMLWS